MTSSLVALAFVASIAVAYSWFARRIPARAATSATSVAPDAVTDAGTAPIRKDVCGQATDPCACATDHGAQLLAACFPERALQVLSRAPNSCTASSFLGVRAEALAAVERGDDAGRMAARVMQIEPANRFARRALAISAIQSRDFQSSDSLLSKLIAEDAQDVDSLYYLALSQRRRDHYNGAREGFLHVLRLNAQHIDARYNLVTLTAAAGAAQEADHDYQELLQIAPVGDPRLSAARAALNKSDNSGPAELPVLHQGAAPEASVVPSR